MKEKEENNKNWKLKLRYGKIKTPFQHYTVLADGIVEELADDFKCPPGKAWMGMKTWSSSIEESMDMIQVIGEQIGFKITGKIYVYDNTEPNQPPRDDPYGYDINFTPYND